MGVRRWPQQPVGGEWTLMKMQVVIGWTVGAGCR